MRLADFISDNHEAIVSEWETFARSLLPPEDTSTSSVLRDHANEILDAIVVDMNSFQSEDEQVAKSKGRGSEGRLGSSGAIHAGLRLEGGFRLDQLVAEYRALRASVLRLWKENARAHDLDGVTRFNEAIDEALSEATRKYMATMQRHRDQFLGILGHDLRNPLGAIIMGASVLTGSEAVDATGARIASGILNSGKRMHRLVGDLLDLTRTQIGAGIPIHRAPMDLARVCREVLAELERSHPGATLLSSFRGELQGEWDNDRLAQLVSNLVGNALQHGKRNGPVRLTARDKGDEVVLTVHNEGPPIPPHAMAAIFEPMVSHDHDDTTRTNLGLGLHIANQVVLAHGGTIAVKSTKAAGTTFVIQLPRRPSVDRRVSLRPRGTADGRPRPTRTRRAPSASNSAPQGSRRAPTASRTR